MFSQPFQLEAAELCTFSITPYDHRVLTPTDSPCSNEYPPPSLPPFLPFSLVPCASIMSMLFPPQWVFPTLESSTLVISFDIQIVQNLESCLISLRRGAPRAHWPEIALAEAAHRVQICRQSPPLLGHLSGSFYQHFTIAELKQFSFSSMKQWYDTTRHINLLLPSAENIEQRSLLTPKLK